MEEDTHIKDPVYRAKLDELIRFAVNNAKREMHKDDKSQGKESLLAHVRTLMPRDNEADQPQVN